MKKISIWLCAISLLAGGCRTSRITSSWKAEDKTPSNFNKILVLALIPQKDRQVQERMEQHVAGDLTNIGYTAMSALQQYGPKAFDNLGEEAALDRIKSSGADMVLTIVLLSKEKERTYVPGRTYYANSFWDYYGMRHQRIYEPGYYVIDTRYFWESNLYDMATQKLLYSAQTKSFSPSSTESMSHEYGLLIVNNMRKQKVLANRE
jgi:hypothetical protein